MIKVYFLTVNYNSRDLINRLLSSLSNENKDKYQIVIVNNSLEDRDLFKLDNNYSNIINCNRNLGFGKACNLGLQWIFAQNSRAIVWLINPDAYFNTSVLDKTISFFASHKQISILGTAVYNSEGEIISAGGTFTAGKAALSTITLFPKDFNRDYIQTDWVSGCSCLINLTNFEQCPQFDSRYFLYYEDLDFCLRYGRQGHQIAVTPLLQVVHDTSSIANCNIFKKYKYITCSYLIHVEKYGNTFVFLTANLRIFLNTIRLLFIKPQQGFGKLIGFCNYWRTKLVAQKLRVIKVKNDPES